MSDIEHPSPEHHSHSGEGGHPAHGKLEKSIDKHKGVFTVVSILVSLAGIYFGYKWYVNRSATAAAAQAAQPEDTSTGTADDGSSVGGGGGDPGSYGSDTSLDQALAGLTSFDQQISQELLSLQAGQSAQGVTNLYVTPPAAGSNPPGSNASSVAQSQAAFAQAQSTPAATASNPAATLAAAAKANPNAATAGAQDAAASQAAFAAAQTAASKVTAKPAAKPNVTATAEAAAQKNKVVANTY